jgi:hypothetical protein
VREFLNAILAFIGSGSLTDDEWNEIDLTSQEYSQAVFDVLKAVLESRDAVSSQLDKLKYFFLAKGVEVSGAEPTPTSQIFIGSAL